MRSTISLGLVLFALVTIHACRQAELVQQDVQDEVVVAPESLAAELAVDRPDDAAMYTERWQAYLEAKPAFYGAAAALLDEAGNIAASPHVHRSADGYRTLDLVRADYNIQEQRWITMPLAAEAGVWTPPYFDAGGGEIWMIARAVPARDSEGVFAIVTTDLSVDAPGGRFVLGQNVDPASPNSSAEPGLDGRCERLDFLARRLPYEANGSCRAWRAQCAGRRCARHSAAAVRAAHSIVAAVRAEDWTRACVGAHLGGTLYATMPSSMAMAARAMRCWQGVDSRKRRRSARVL